MKRVDLRVRVTYVCEACGGFGATEHPTWNAFRAWYHQELEAANACAVSEQTKFEGLAARSREWWCQHDYPNPDDQPEQVLTCHHCDGLGRVEEEVPIVAFRAMVEGA